jgi:hypothetical protein
MSDQDYTAQEKAALVTWHLAHGEELTTAEIALMAGLTFQGAWFLMIRLARVLPIYRNDAGVWAVCVLRELEYAGIF